MPSLLRTGPPNTHQTRLSASVTVTPQRDEQASDQALRDAALASFAEQLDRLPAICFASQAALREARRAVGLRSPFFLPYLGAVDLSLLRRHGRLAADIMAANDPARGATPRVQPVCDQLPISGRQSTAHSAGRHDDRPA